MSVETRTNYFNWTNENKYKTKVLVPAKENRPRYTRDMVLISLNFTKEQIEIAKNKLAKVLEVKFFASGWSEERCKLVEKKYAEGLTPLEHDRLVSLSDCGWRHRFIFRRPDANDSVARPPVLKHGYDMRALRDQ